MTDWTKATDDELNAACARAVGWKEIDAPHYGPWEKLWISPEEDECLFPPQYTHSLDACVRDLVPVLHCEGKDVSIDLARDGDAALIHPGDMDIEGENSILVEGKAARAFCEAFMQSREEKR